MPNNRSRGFAARRCALVVGTLLAATVAATSLAAPPPAEPATPLAADAVIADFNAGLPAGLEASPAAKATHDVQADVSSLKVVPGGQPGPLVPAVFVPLTGRVDPTRTGGVSLSV